MRVASITMSLLICHVLAQSPAHHLPSEKVNHYSLIQPALIGPDAGYVAHPDLVGFAHYFSA